MKKREIYTRFYSMQGDPQDRIRILAQINNCTEREIREIMQEVASGRCNEPELDVYHADDNPFCKVKVEVSTENHKGDIPEHVLDLIFDRLDELEREIKEREKEYKSLIEYIGGGKA